MRLTLLFRLLRLLWSQFLPHCNFGLHGVLQPGVNQIRWYVCRRTIVQPIRLHPCVCLFLLPCSRSLVFSWLMALPTCFCHLWISPPAKSLRIGLLNSNLISCHRDIYCVAYMGASKSYQQFNPVFTLNEASFSSLNGDLYQRFIPCRFTGPYPKLCKKSSILICLVVWMSMMYEYFNTL